MKTPERGELLYEGKAKRLYATDEEDLLVVEFKDEATAFNAVKRGVVSGKGAANNLITQRVYAAMEAVGIPTHLVGGLSDTEQVVERVAIVPIEVVVRNRAAGSFSKRYGVEEGLPLAPAVVEWCVKSDELGDPTINDAAAVALGLASEQDLAELFELATSVNDALKAYFARLDLELIDLKLEFGRASDGAMVLADEVSPDTCRLWDLKSGERLDKDRFRRDLPDVEGAYAEVLRRVGSQAGDPEAFAASYVPLEDDPLETPPQKDHTAAVVSVMLKPAILDPQGRAVLETLRRLGYDSVVDVRIGKRIEVELEPGTARAESVLREMAERVLSNPVMEEYRLEMEGDDGTAE